MSLDNINFEQQLYVIRESGGFSCLGFAVACDRTIMYLQRMGHVLPDAVPFGSREAFELYQSIERQYIAHPSSQATSFDPHTPDQVKAILEDARLRHFRLRIYIGDRETGLDWNEEHDVLGYIGRSMGPIRVPLLLRTRASSGGPAILTACIVKLQSAGDRRVLWQHPAYHSRTFSIGPAVNEGYTEAAYRSGSLHAQFKKSGDAGKFIDKMLGRRMS